MFTCLTPLPALLDIEIYEATGTVCADTGASQSVGREASESISPSDKECFQNNQPECDDKDESKRQDICAGNSSKGAFFGRQRRIAYRSDAHFQDGRRDSFKRVLQNTGYRNQNNERQHPSFYRENNYHYQGGKFAQKNHSGRNCNRRSHGNSNWYSREENLHYFNDKRVYNRRDEPYIVLSQSSPTTFVVASCDKPDEPLSVYHTSALTPFLNGTETQSPVVPLKKRGRPRKQPLILRGTAGENAFMSASTPPPPSPRRSSAVYRG
ncbi:retrovirus-related Pol polyprotein from transposon 412 [Trichonephila inaurata madagascariensis]|uniref:Retrovirus-related Pol polyprotein from transposon 412 n=1 Tax=Trichonephila inaurata madagascariensis TaxID=2747483 RepID=A0A8X7CEL9_9ARAC|nr:retrovirus-related Pol polyprotein from transposon 412 [Trichonephila inaurata madagascariensis]